MRSVKDIFKGKDFLWGSATAAYQCEGGWNAGGKVAVNGIISATIAR